MVVVDLGWPEVLLAVNAGVMRRLNAIRNKRQEPYGVRATAAWNDDINGAIAELALAKHLNIFWSGTVGRIDLPDVGVLQVRSKTQEDHRLVVLESDDDTSIFVSVFVGVPVCRLDGWIAAAEAKRKEWLLPDPEKPNRYFVPNKSLRHINELR